MAAGKNNMLELRMVPTILAEYRGKGSSGNWRRVTVNENRGLYLLRGWSLLFGIWFAPKSERGK